jgi:hypothetical protein
MIETLEMLYYSEINYKLSCFYDAGYFAGLGDESNGFVATAEGFDSIEEAIVWLAEQAVTHYPNSRFAKDFSAE